MGGRPRRRLSVRAENKFWKAIEIYLSEWSELENACNVLRSRRKAELSACVFEFLVTTAEPKMDDLADVMHRFVCTKVDGLIDFNDCKKAAQQFLDIYQSSVNKKSRRRKHLKRSQYINKYETIYECEEGDRTSTDWKQLGCHNGKEDNLQQM
ncbi:hypothetical protein L484_011663 [Morus notabilis]|uniref:Uncharacterized protein n=1 Tax=Morus notabilis TaxID=981085 RepID=W9RN24_9ROSA|nr:hypothetical protein L484_011663 [Morus notabilis]